MIGLPKKMATKKDFIVAMEEEHNDINTFEAFNHGELRVTRWVLPAFHAVKNSNAILALS